MVPIIFVNYNSHRSFWSAKIALGECHRHNLAGLLLKQESLQAKLKLVYDRCKYTLVQPQSGDIVLPLATSP
jgi:hypothetical protein